jgi:cellulose biosynthesis protein BcsQ
VNMLPSDAQDDVSRLCRSVRMDPSAYKRFDLPRMITPAPRSEPQVQAHPPELPAASVEPDRGPVSNVQAVEKSHSLERIPVRTAVPRAHDDAGRDAGRPALRLNVSFPVIPSDTSGETPGSINKNLAALANLNRRTFHQPAVLSVRAAAGGCGVTTVVAGLGRALSILGEHVLLVDSGISSTLDYFYGGQADESRFLLSTQALTPFEGEVHVVRTETETSGDLQRPSTGVHRAVAQLRGKCDRIIVAGKEGMTTSVMHQLKASGLCLVVLTPELRSRRALPSIMRAFTQFASGIGVSVRPWFLLNRFDQSCAEHLEFRRAFADELGSQLLPFCIPDSPTVSRSLAHRVNPIDLSPQSEFAEACFNLAEWYRSIGQDVESGITQPEENQLVSD